jgi:hypothetical protein
VVAVVPLVPLVPLDVIERIILTTAPTPERVIERLLQRFTVEPSGCWVSDYSTGSHGYSQVGWQADGKLRVRLAHRVAYEAYHGRIPNGMTVDHICRNRRCIHPEHLRLLSHEENSRRNGNWAKTHCHRGHPFDELNTYRTKRGHRHCRACGELRYREAA